MLPKIFDILKKNNAIGLKDNEFMDNKIIVPLFSMGAIACFFTEWFQKQLGIQNSFDTILLYSLGIFLLVNTFLTLFYKSLMTRMVMPVVLSIGGFFILRVYNAIHGETTINTSLLASVVCYVPIMYLVVFMFLKAKSSIISYSFYTILTIICLLSPDLLKFKQSNLISTELIFGLIGVQPLFILACTYFSDVKTAAIESSHNEKIDVLTGIKNRRAIQSVINNRKGSVNFTDNTISSILIDIDNFKHINDNYGHHIGDEILKLVAQQLNLSVRAQDIAGRWGGEEFIVLLFNTDAPTCYAIAEKIRHAIDSLMCVHVGKVTVSVGVAINTEMKTTCIETLINAADGALYKAKKSGKNKVIMA